MTCKEYLDHCKAGMDKSTRGLRAAMVNHVSSCDDCYQASLSAVMEELHRRGPVALLLEVAESLEIQRQDLADPEFVAGLKEPS